MGFLLANLFRYAQVIIGAFCLLNLELEKLTTDVKQWCYVLRIASTLSTS
jgi:hypothetical protein